MVVITIVLVPMESFKITIHYDRPHINDGQTWQQITITNLGTLIMAPISMYTKGSPARFSVPSELWALNGGLGADVHT